jgi:hypothetical protein
MESVEPSGKLSIRNARLFGIIFLAYSIVLPFIILFLPKPEVSVNIGTTILSWLMICLMPIELLLLYAFYRYYRNKPDLDNIMGPAILMYMFATIPSIYAFVIGFIDPDLQSLAIPLGLAFSLLSFWFALKFVSNLWEKFTSFNQEQF